MAVELRDFKVEDREFFITCAIEFYSSDAVAGETPVAFFERTFETCIEGSPFAQGIIFLVDGQRAGYALLSFTYSNEVGGLVVLVEEAYILREYRGMGMATDFFKTIEERYVKNGNAKRLRLEVTEENVGAQALYQRLGFKPMTYINMHKDFID